MLIKALTECILESFPMPKHIINSSLNAAFVVISGKPGHRVFEWECYSTVSQVRDDLTLFQLIALFSRNGNTRTLNHKVFLILRLY